MSPLSGACIMITILTGDNDFELQRALRRIEEEFDGRAEKYDGVDLDLKQLPDLVMGITLFADKRLVIVKDMSANKTLWNELPAYLPRISDDVHLVLVEPKLDKRTKTYKDLQKNAAITTYKAWGERDSLQAEKWVADESKRRGIMLDAKNIRLLVARVGLDQWLLDQALYKLSFVDEINAQTIETLIDANPTENVFNLFEAALGANKAAVTQMIRVLSLSEDPFRLLGLLSGQAFQLAALAVADKSSAEVAKDIGAHPFAVGKLATHAKKLGRSGARSVVAAFVEADSGMKKSVADPWLLIERALLKVATMK